MSVPAAERTKVVEDDLLRGFFVSECNDEEMYEAVKLLGGRPAQAAGLDGDGGLRGRLDQGARHAVTDAKASVAASTTSSSRAKRILQDERPRPRRRWPSCWAGRPDEQLSLFQNDVPIKLLTWAHAVGRLGRRPS